MAAFSPASFAATGFWPNTGLRPEPQGAGALAAGAADQRIDAGARPQASSGKIVFDRHSTQCSIAARLRRATKELRRLAVDGAVYKNAASVYKSAPDDLQMPECAAQLVYTNACGKSASREALPLP